MIVNYGTMAVNINDFARYAPKRRMVFVQILIVPLSFMLMAFMGVIIDGSASQLYGEDIWDPLTIMAHWTGSGRARAGAAFVGLAFVLAQLGSNISANCISAANDLNAMFPRVRGSHQKRYLTCSLILYSKSISVVILSSSLSLELGLSAHGRSFHPLEHYSISWTARLSGSVTNILLHARNSTAYCLVARANYRSLAGRLLRDASHDL